MNTPRLVRIASGVSGPALLCVVVGLVFGQLFGSAEANFVLVGAALVPTLLVVVITRGTPTRTGLVIAVGIVALVVYGVEAAAVHVSGGVPGASAWHAFGRGLDDGWKELLTVGLPATANGSLEITPVVIVWIAGLSSALLALRRSGVLAPLGPPLAAFVVALMVGSGRPSPSDLIYAGLFVVFAVLTLLVRVDRQPADSPPPTPDDPWAPADAWEHSPPPPDIARQSAVVVSRAGFALPAVLATVAIAFGVTNALPVAAGTHRFDPRKYVHRAVQVNDQVSPLVELNAVHAEKPPSTLFQVTIQPSGNAVMPDRMQVATLDVFDGAHWTSDARFVVAGSRLDAGTHSRGELSETVMARSSNSWQLGPFLPVAGTPLRISHAAGSVYDQAGGQLATTVANPGGYRYTAVASPLVSAAAVSAQLASVPVEPATLIAYPDDLPGKLDLAVRAILATDKTPISQLAAIDTYLHTNESYDPAAPPGESIAALTEFADGHAPGDSAQFAEAFALMAREGGIPARIAVGYLLTKSVGSGQFVVTTADAWAWPEADLSPYGWVAFDPAKGAHAGTGQQQQQKQGGGAGAGDNGNGGGIVQLGQAQNGSGSGSGTSGGKSGAGAGVAGAVRTATLWVLVGLVCLAVPPAAILAAKRRRRQRRLKAPTPGERVIGAWREARDRLLEHDLKLSWALTPLEAAGAVEERFAPTPPVAMNDLALLVTDALYSPFGVAESEADQSWNLVGSLEEELGRLDSRLSHWRRRLDPRPLFAPRAEHISVDRALVGTRT